MQEKKRKPTLQDLSKQIFAIVESYERAAVLFKGLEDLPENERNQTALGVVADLVYDFSTAIKTAIETNHPAVYKPLTSWDDPISVISLLASTEMELIESLEKAFWHLEERTWRECLTQERRDWHEYSSAQFPKRFIQPYKLLYKRCMRNFKLDPRLLKMAADDLAGVFLKEQTESEQVVRPAKRESKEVAALNPPDKWVTVGEAAKIANVEPGTVSRWAAEGKIEDNAEKGLERRIKKSSLLFWIDKRKERERQRGYEEYSRTLDHIPDKH